MTRVGTSINAASLTAHADAARERSQQTTVARFAVLYRGTITFSYARTQQAAMRGSQLARKLAALNARRRNAARRTGMRRPIVVTGNDASEHAPDAADSGRITRDGGGGRGNGGQSHDGRDGADGENRENGAPRTQVRMRSSGRAAIAAPERGPLQKFVEVQAGHADLSEMLPRLWCDALLASRDEAAVRPQASLDALLHERFIDLLRVQLQTGAPGDADMGAWRQRLIDASASRGAGSDRAGAGAGGEASAEQIGRTGRLNLLMPLLLLMYGKPSTSPMRERALNVRIVQRGAALAAAARR
ncbi:type III secretion regulatory protein HpaA [Burkholderia sp. OAS925]|uniref:hypothetical protein n=1 Tax=Paraburkholderia TaxID=1822464 RepID=UPI001789F85F|nr:hypothetical protein [Paraburkholderia graminis]MDR6476135.1 hypothetical protein [Paraburkholderia graminis]